ncbi:HEAT repeat domain-containing protein [Roseiflexus sp.]
MMNTTPSDNNQTPNDINGSPSAETDGETANGAQTGTRSLVQAPRALATSDRRVSAHVASAALQQRIMTLVSALGDPGHPLHTRAVEDLVTLGEPAVPALIEALRTREPWLVAYRATEALGQIGDGRAAGPLVDALRHPNSNVRWGAVRALATVGDARALLELRRVARTDRSKTSWGESVGDTARVVLDQMQSRTLLARVAELIKTAIACVLMLVALIFAWSVLTELRDELTRIGRVEPAPVIIAPPMPTTVPQAIVTLPQSPTSPPTLQPTLQPVAPTPVEVPPLAGIVVTSGNVRATPARLPDNVIGSVMAGDALVFLGVTPDGAWYRVRLGSPAAASSQIRSVDGSGWVSASLVEAPERVPVETPPPVPTPTP